MARVGVGETASMGKRSDFKRAKGDFYRTPLAAVAPLIPHLPKSVRFCEPCAGDGALVHHLQRYGHICVASWDIRPRSQYVLKADALEKKPPRNAAMFITNPPWTRSLLHPLIERLSSQRPTWLLFDADWMHTRQADQFWQRCAKIVSIGRVKWIKDSPHVGKDNACWYLFEPGHNTGPRFVGRA
jgi:hypothetical protein